MITVIARLQAAEGKADELRAILEKMIGEVKAAEPGVAVYSLHTSDTEPGLFLFYEQYRDAEAFDAHSKTPHMAAMGASLRGVVAGRPVIERYTQIAGL